MIETAAKTVEDGEITERIIVRGAVQGVGFRPTVWRLAKKFGVRGSVANSGIGVEIIARAPVVNLESFVKALRNESPPLARIVEIKRTVVEFSPAVSGFLIAESLATPVQTGVMPDASVCAACREEIFDPFARRFRYPFTNCTHCGPRFSIIENIPYDRENTMMRGFRMCDQCRAEYENPADRRFHAQPVACHKCGPKVRLERADGKPLAIESFTMLDETDAVCTLIQKGFIVAVKGIGGFQLACDATSEQAVSRLRKLKHREMKPFALMVADPEIAGNYCRISEAEAEILQSPSAPIVILERLDEGGNRKNQPPIAENVAPNIKTLGVMLPNTPLHHLMMRRMKRPIVLTSGNISDEPQCVENAEAVERLGKIADYFLSHDRPIARRVDDSIVKLYAGEPRVLRRARGYAPAALQMPKGFEDAPRVLAFGGELKNSFCLLGRGEAILSQHIGDLADALTQADYKHNLQLYETIFRHRAEAFACDLHPEYLSGKLAREKALKEDLPLVETQHHHAHIAACMAENGAALGDFPVIGAALDGLGFGEDGTFWGGEFMIADYVSYKRLATFKPVAMPGGEKAVKEPWRNTYAHLSAEMGWAKFAMNYDNLELFAFLDAKPRALLDEMLRKRINSPLASSCGRLFDAVAAAIGIACEQAFYEGQGAVELEQAVDEKTLRDEDESLAYPFAIPRLKETNLPYIEPLAMWQALLGDLILKTPAPVISARFHKGLAKTIVQMIEKLSRYETNGIRTIALSGGVWQNKVLFEEVVRRLREKDFKVLTHRQLPNGDGGLALGQAAIAAARLKGETSRV